MQACATLTHEQDDHNDANHKVHWLQDVLNDLKCDAEQLYTNIMALQAQLEQAQNLQPPPSNDSGCNLEALHTKNAKLCLQLE